MKNFFKISFLFIFLLFFIGCSNKNNEFLYKNKSGFFKEKWIEPIKTNISVKEQVLNMDKEIFNDKPEIDHTILNVNEEFIENNDDKVNYTSAVKAYKYVLEYKNINDLHLKSYDYLKLYKALKINNPKLFKNMKDIIIKKFMIEISDIDYLDTKKISEVLKKEELSKINKLIKILKDKNNE